MVLARAAKSVVDRVACRVNGFPSSVIQGIRCLYYRGLSDCRSIEGSPNVVQPVLLTGQGRIRFGQNVTLGVKPSPGLYSGYGHYEARSPDSLIDIADNVWLNNNACLISAGPGISIGNGCRVGPQFVCFDSDFHEIPLRGAAPVRTGGVFIDEQVFIGANVTILRGVTVGRFSVIGAGSVVTNDIPACSVVSGNPAVVRRKLSAPVERSELQRKSE